MRVDICDCAEVRVAIFPASDPMRRKHPFEAAADRPSGPDAAVFDHIRTECTGLAACGRTAGRRCFEVLPRNSAGSVEEQCWCDKIAKPKAQTGIPIGFDTEGIVSTSGQIKGKRPTRV